MASRKNLKKDINYLENEVISDCFAYMYVHPDKNKDKVMNIIEESVQVRNELVSKINKAKLEKDPKKVKDYFKEIRKEMFENIDNSFQNLSKLSK
ncbi:MAG: hypothetical protein HY958_00825 [Bacteroidia bacterium]|nr:hypothetical protein [Bacteroidia bacterium]